MKKKFSSITGLSMYSANKGERMKLRLVKIANILSITEESRIEEYPKTSR